ncbi:MAG: polymer-forming cytoskeletal protein [Campylobacterales bacterium]
MGIFGRSNKVAGAGGASIISSGTKIIGQLALKDSFYIDGEIEGDINSEALITVGKNGLVIGKLVAKSVIIGGEVKGKVECENCEILSGGKIKGEVYSSSLVIEAGGILEGSSYVKNNGLAPVQSVKKSDSE